MRKKKILMILALLLTAVTQGAWADDGIYCTASDVGRVVCTDGSIYDNVSAAEADGKTAVAMIAYLDTENNKGLALALADESDWMAWSTAISTCSAKTPTVTGGTWKLATKDEWDLMISAAGSYNALHDGFSSVGGTNMQWNSTYYYWSSTEYDSDHAWSYNSNGDSWHSNDHKDNCNYVRACLAFDFNTPVTKMADNWYMISRQTQTRQSDWTALSAGSTTGRTLGSADAVTYYYATGDLSFTNSTVGGSGLTIQGTVYLYIPSGTTLTCTGANASGQTGAGAGIELTLGNSLYLIGGGTLNANGGNAANGGNGTNGSDASCKWDDMEWAWVGGNGHGGNGGGGAGAGIGTRGGTGGAGGNAPEPEIYYTTWTQNGVVGGDGSAGQTADAMGVLFVSIDITLTATGGKQGSAGTAGTAGKSCMRYGTGYEYSIPGGGGGGAGGFGGAASNIGTGGPGGGGGGGGAKGSHDYVSTGFYIIYANGGAGGQNADGSYAATGGTAGVSTANINNGTCDTNNLSWVQAEERGKESSDVKTTTNGGNGSTAGSASVGGSYGTVTVDWTTQGKGTEDAPFIVSSTDDWNVFADYVNSGYAFSGEFVKLTNDISVSMPAGIRKSDSYNWPFSGTFLGDGHTITAALAIDGKQGLAPFRSINGATIRDLKVAGTIASNQNHTAGIAGFASGTNTIEDCLVTATLNISSDYAGGIIGHGLTSATTIRGCAFTGTVNGVDGNRSNIGGLWGWSDNATPALVNCLEAGTYTNIASMHPMGLQKAAGTITNCYYTTPQIGSPSNVCTVSGATEAVATATAPANLGDAVEDYGMVKAYQNGILVGGTYYVVPATVTLADNADNGTTISNANGYVANVTLTGRTLYKDGAWNTICLPFALTAEDIAASPLAGADIRELDATGTYDTNKHTGFDATSGTLYLYFKEATSIVAGRPYIVKWASGSDIENPVFSGVTVTSTEAQTVEATNSGLNTVGFIGTYSPVPLAKDDKSNLFLGVSTNDNGTPDPADDYQQSTLFYPNTADYSVNACRAYFHVDLTGSANVRAINLNFGEGSEETIISPAEIAEIAERADAWYTIDGVKLNGKPNVKGLYINNGRKVVIK